MDDWLLLWVRSYPFVVDVDAASSPLSPADRIASLYATIYLGNAIGNAAVQGQMVISGLWGMLYYREVRQKWKIAQFFVSMLITLTGVVLLALFG